MKSFEEILKEFENSDNTIILTDEFIIEAEKKLLKILLGSD